MSIPFYKYQATGNDFILIDNRDNIFPDNKRLIPKICDRKFGIGSDGLMLIQNHNSCDFELIFYNPDASQSLCGNGSRCAVQFANFLGIVGESCSFMAFDGIHEATINTDKEVRLKMQNVQNVRLMDDGMLVDTGSPHLISIQNAVADLDVFEKGRDIRYNNVFRDKGVNVNFVEKTGSQEIFVRTYERGVEDETLSCGTGVTAAALAAGFEGMTSPVNIVTRGGKLAVEFKMNSDQKNTSGPDVTFEDVYLIGPAKKVFSGTIDLDLLQDN